MRASGLLLFSFLFFYIATLTNAFDDSDDLNPAEFIVVLSSNLNSDGSADATTLSRTLKGISLYKQGLAPKILLSGGIVGNNTANLAGVMAQIAFDEDVPESDIIIENRSKSTLQNALFAHEFIEFSNSIIIVTSPFHAPRSSLTFQAIGFTNTQMATTGKDRPMLKQLRNIAREVPAFWFNFIRYPVWRVLNLGDRRPATDWLLA